MTQQSRVERPVMDSMVPGLARLMRLIIWGVWLLLVMHVAVRLVQNTPARYHVLQAEILHDLGAAERIRLLSATALTFEMLPILAFIAIGLFLFWQKPEDWWVVFCSGLIITLGFDQSFIGEIDDSQAFGAVVTAAAIVVWYLFPNGRFEPRWAWMPAAAWVLATVYWYLRPDAWMNPLYTNSTYQATPWPLYGVMTAFSLLGLWSQIVRYRRAPVAERQQTKWILLGFCTILAAGTIQYLPAIGVTGASPAGVLVRTPVVALLALGWPVSIVFAVLQYRLWDVDIIINRALVYTLLVALLLALYVLVITLLSGVLRYWFLDDAFLPSSLIATAAVTIALQPLRTRVQRLVNRLMFGDRDDPYKVMQTLARQLEKATDIHGTLPELIARIGQSLKLGGMAVTMAQGDTRPHSAVQPHRETQIVVASYPDDFAATAPADAVATRIPLRYQNRVVGELLLGARSRGEALTPQDLALLHDITPMLGVAVHNLRLTQELQHTLEQVVLAQEEERRRIRNDLHDDLGPKLATLRLRIDNAGRAIRQDPTVADSMLSDLTELVKEAIGDVRHIIRGLRPPELEELGLLKAVAASLQQQRGLAVEFHTPATLPKLPAAVESAAYRIVQEAVTNVVKHSEAGTCSVRIRLEAGALVLVMQDDGQGFDAADATGIGLRSMRERATVLGGTLDVSTRPGHGTTITAILPLRAGSVPLPQHTGRATLETNA